METKLQKQIVDFFSFFEEFYNTSKTCLKTCQCSALSINKLIERCRYIKKAETADTPLEQFEGLQTKLFSSIIDQIHGHIIRIQSQRLNIQESFEKLFNKRKVLIESCENIDLTANTNLVKGTPFQLPLKRLLEFVAEAITFGGQICAQIDTSLRLLQFQKENTESQVENFKISLYWQKKVHEILLYTSFCAENEI